MGQLIVTIYELRIGGKRETHKSFYSKEITLVTGSLPTGIYCVQISQKGQVVTKTWIKN
ncbi:MAG: T9SS type A sorting domain-containing protein [Saprospiraceae bacterium]|nr:T9SS type A sorting domain-containing protein [Saprospiraceae bacterium]